MGDGIRRERDLSTKPVNGGRHETKKCESSLVLTFTWTKELSLLGHSLVRTGGHVAYTWPSFVVNYIHELAGVVRKRLINSLEVVVIYQVTRSTSLART